MAEPFIGEVRLFGGDYAPRNWAFCNGQLLTITGYTALYAVLGTVYGGDGRATFALPDLRGRATLSTGQHPGSNHNYQLGERAGLESVTLTLFNIPEHNHLVQVYNKTGAEALHNYLGPNHGATGTMVSSYADPETTTNIVNMGPSTISEAGGAVPIDNRQPYAVVNYIIALQGIHPSPS